jgi:hypothetical protein
MKISEDYVASFPAGIWISWSVFLFSDVLYRTVFKYGISFSSLKFPKTSAAAQRSTLTVSLLFTMAVTKTLRVIVASLILLQIFAFPQPTHPASRRSGLCMGAICPEIPLTPRPGHEIAIVASG